MNQENHRYSETQAKLDSRPKIIDRTQNSRFCFEIDFN